MYLSGQLGTAQLGLAQLGQFKKSFSISINASAQSPQPATATPLVSGGRISGGIALEAARYISAQLGTAQLGLAQLGQFERQFPLGVNASTLPPLAVVATALHVGAMVSGGDAPLDIGGSVQPPQAVTATALVGGAALKTPGVIGGVEPSGFWWWWMPGEFTLKMIDDMLADGDGQEMNERRT